MLFSSTTAALEPRVPMPPITTIDVRDSVVTAVHANRGSPSCSCAPIWSSGVMISIEPYGVPPTLRPPITSAEKPPEPSMKPPHDSPRGVASLVLGCLNHVVPRKMSITSNWQHSLRPPMT